MIFKTIKTYVNFTLFTHLVSKRNFSLRTLHHRPRSGSRSCRKLSIQQVVRYFFSLNGFVQYYKKVWAVVRRIWIHQVRQVVKFLLNFSSDFQKVFKYSCCYSTAYRVYRVPGFLSIRPNRVPHPLDHNNWVLRG
jgi:hypothetical protein